MKVWKLMASFILCALILGGCNAASGGAAQVESDEPALSVESIYADEDTGLEIQFSPAYRGEYRISCGEQETFWELAAAPEDIIEIQVQPWGEEGMFLVLTARLKDRTEDTFILNREMMTQVMMQDPAVLAKDSLAYTVKEEKRLFLLGEQSFYIECGDREALTALGENLWVADEVDYGVEDGKFACYIPVRLGPKDEVGNISLYYEYDGVGMNCMDAGFVPSY